jgi:hypothetical protein
MYQVPAAVPVAVAAENNSKRDADDAITSRNTERGKNI